MVRQESLEVYVKGLLKGFANNDLFKVFEEIYKTVLFK